MEPMWRLVLCALCHGKPRQPKLNYLKVPTVPDAPSILAPLLSSASSASSALSPGAEAEAVGCDEACFVAFAGRRVHAAAAKAWARLDANGDQHLDLEEARAS